MVPGGNKAKRLSSVNHTTKAIHHHHNEAPVGMKYVRANVALFMRRAIENAIMKRSRLRKIFLKNPTNENNMIYKKQRNLCVTL